MKRIAPFLLFTLLAIGLGFSLYQRPAEPVKRVAANLPQITLTTLEAPDEKQLFAPQKNKLTLLNFFASWCVPCLAEHAELKALAADGTFTLEGVVWNDTPKNIRPWLKKHGNPYRQIWFDRSGDAAITLGLRGVPESFLIDQHGKIRLHIQGGISPSMRAEILDLAKGWNNEEAADAR